MVIQTQPVYDPVLGSVPIIEGVETQDVISRARALIDEAMAAGLNAKPFCRLPEVQLPGATFTVQGPDFLWQLTPIENYENLIPSHAMKAMAWSTAKGFSTRDLWVAYPSGWDCPEWQTDSLMISGLVEVSHTTAQAIGHRALQAGRAAQRVASTTASKTKSGASKTVLGLGLALAALGSLASATVRDPVLALQVSHPTTAEAMVLELARWE